MNFSLAFVKPLSIMRLHSSDSSLLKFSKKKCIISINNKQYYKKIIINVQFHIYMTK